MNAKDKLISDFAGSLPASLSSDEVREVTNKLILALRNYDVGEKCTALVEVDTESVRILKKYLATKRLEGRSEKTIERYRYILTRYMNEAEVSLVESDVFALRLYLAELGQNGCSDRTVNGVRSVLSAFYGWAYNEGFVPKNPAANLAAIKCRKEIRKPYSNVELEIIRTACETKRDRALVEFLLSSGCRIEEVTRLNASDINFAAHECKVLGKGNKERVVFLTDVCILHLRRYLRSRNDENEALFIGKGSERLLPGGVRAMLKRIEARTGVENIHPHRFRRTLATSLIDRGMAIQDVAAILGHANINTTTTYIFTDTENIKSSYKRLAS